MNALEWMLVDTLKATTPLFNWVPEIREEVFKSKKLGSGAKQITVTSNGWISDSKTANLRFARFTSKVIDVATIMIYPTSSPDLLPIFAAEFVIIANKFHVVVMDVTFLENRIKSDLLTIVSNKWINYFPYKKEIPDWFLEIMTENSIFSATNIAELPKIQLMFNEYLDVVLSEYYQKFNKISKSGLDHILVAAYKKHHAENSPAHKIVSQDNSEWLNEFLYHNHFKVLK